MPKTIFGKLKLSGIPFPPEVGVTLCQFFVSKHLLSFLFVLFLLSLNFLHFSSFSLFQTLFCASSVQFEQQVVLKKSASIGIFADFPEVKESVNEKRGLY